jgi:hypothetical protein
MFAECCGGVVVPGRATFKQRAAWVATVLRACGKDRREAIFAGLAAFHQTRLTDERERVCVCVCERESECGCVCVCECG